MKTILIFLLFPFYLLPQKCSFYQSSEPDSGDKIYLAFDHGDQRFYLDGVSLNGPKVVMRQNLLKRSGAVWVARRNWRGKTYTFDSGGRKLYLDGKTQSGGLTLRNSTSYRGTSWSIIPLGKGKFAVKANSTGAHLYLSFDGKKVRLIKQRNRTTDGWMFISHLKKKRIFHANREGYRCFRIPSLLQLHNGHLLAFAEGRVNNCHDYGDIDVVMKRSTDGGKTWSKLLTVWNNGKHTCGNPTVVQGKDKRIWLFGTQNVGPDRQKDIEKGSAEGVRTIWYLYSDDNGTSWSKPNNISAFVQDPKSNGWDATGPGTGILTKSGKIIIPANDRDIYSNDGGRSWCISPLVPRGSSEAQVVELENGEIMRNSRQSGSATQKGYRTVISSTNKYQAWGKMQSDLNLISPTCQGSIFRLTFRSECGQSRIVFGNPAHPTTRRNYTIYTSLTEGQSWKFKKTIWPKGSGYSSISFNKRTGGIGLLLEESDKDKVEGNYGNISFFTMSYDFLTDGRDRLPSP